MGRRARQARAVRVAVLRRTALRRGLLGDSRAWRYVFFAMVGGRMLRKLFGKSPEVVAIQKLLPGHVLQIRTLPQATKEDRRRYRRFP